MQATFKHLLLKQFVYIFVSVFEVIIYQRDIYFSSITINIYNSYTIFTVLDMITTMANNYQKPMNFQGSPWFSPVPKTEPMILSSDYH